MKLFTVLLLAALLGSSIAAPRRVSRMSDESEESQEIELEAEEVEVEVPQDDDVSEEDDDPPPKFHELFPTPKKAGVSTHGPQNFAFANMLQEIEENGWKRPKGIKNQKQRRQRGSLKPVFRADDDDDSDEDEEDDDAEDDEPFAPDFDTMFPNPEGKPSGPQNLPQLDLGGPASVESFRSGLLGVAPVTGRSQSQKPMYYVASSGNRRPARPQTDRAPMTMIRGVAYRQPNGNRRVSSAYQFPMSYYTPQKQMSYRPPQQQVSYRPQQQVVYVPQQQVSYVQMPYRQRQPGPVYYVQQVQRQPQYYQSNNRRNYVPMNRQQSRPSYTQNYVQRMRRNDRYWN